jgi:hypothetical protein
MGRRREKGWFGEVGVGVLDYSMFFINHRWHIKTNSFTLKAAKFQAREEVPTT